MAKSKKIPAKVRKIHIGTYYFDVFYLVSSREKCIKAFKEHFLEDISNKDLRSGWATSLEGDNGQGAYFIWMHEEQGFDCIAHEVFHAVKYILCNYAGLTLSGDSDEAFAYLLAHICHQVIHKKGEICNGEQAAK